jgi:hypothetical protein
MTVNSNMEDYLNVLQQNIPSGLLNNKYRECIRNIGRKLPRLSFGFFELWFGKYQSRVDLNIGIDRRLNENETMIAYLDNDALAGPLASLEKPIKRWSALDLQLWLFTHCLILVYDIPDPRQSSITPWYYITYDPPPFFNNDISFQTEIIPAILGILDESVSSGIRSSWNWLFNNTFSATRVYALGFQANRQVDALRVVLIFDTFTDICSFLAEHNWLGDVDEMQEQTSDIIDGCDGYRLTIDVTPALQSKIGFECLYNLNSAENGYKRLTDKLVALGICTDAQQGAFLTWNGSFDLKNDPNEWSWPDKYNGLPYLVPTMVNIKRSPKHIKIIYEPGNLITAKGYLGFHKPLL